MSKRIRGISRSALWTSWKKIRKELKRSARRDVIDFLEYDIDPDVWINRLIRQIESGEYEPSFPQRFSLAKGSGFSRRMTAPTVPDAVLYRAIVDWLYQRASRWEQKHAYFTQKALSGAQQKAVAEARKKMGYDKSDLPYRSSDNGFLRWLCFEQYKKFLLLKKLNRYIVITDISNFFDSILHKRISESLHNIPAPSPMIGLLFLLLERLAIRDSYGDSLQVGLAVDEFECSRTLAHIMLFPHDEEMVQLVGEDYYVRWVDDQNFGVGSKAEALNVLAAVQRSLARLNLTPNTAKTRILTLTESRGHFHFDINASLDDAFSKPHRSAANKKLLRAHLNGIWNKAKTKEDHGEWTKILSRMYRLAALANSRKFRLRAIRDMIRYPKYADRIANYMRCTGTTAEYIEFAESLWEAPEQIYSDVNRYLLEITLRLEADGSDALALREIAVSFLRGKRRIPGAVECAAIAPILLLRFGDRRSLRSLKAIVQADQPTPSEEVFKAAAVVYGCFGGSEFNLVRRAASKLPRNNVADVVRLIARVRKYSDVPNRYKVRLALRRDSLLNMKYMDMRSLIALRILFLNKKKKVQEWISDKVKKYKSETELSDFDKALIDKYTR